MTNLATGRQFPDGGKMVTRRDSLKGLAAIFAAGVAPALLGQTARGLMHRNLGGRIATGGGGAKPYSSNPYITTDGTTEVILDAEWNDGFESHVLSSEIKDLSGNGRNMTLENGILRDKFIEVVSSASSSKYAGKFNTPSRTMLTVEMVYETSTPSGSDGIALIEEFNYDYVWGISKFADKTYVKNSTNASPCGFGYYTERQDGLSKILIGAYYDTRNDVVPYLNGVAKQAMTPWGSPNGYTYGSARLLKLPAVDGYIGKIYSIRLYSRNLNDEERLAHDAADKYRFGIP